METITMTEFTGEETTGGFLIVGIGASAGGIPALKEFFQQVPAGSGIAYVVILHLSPDHDSKLAEILQVVASIPVTQVLESTRIKPDHIYVVPPNQHLIIDERSIAPSINTNMEERRAPVDIFFRHLADTHGPRAVCVVLSGTGANGSMGLKRIKERGGVAYVQNPKEAEFNEMPRNSIATELVDEVLNVADIPAHIIAYRNSLGSVRIIEESEKGPETQQQALREIFTQLRLRTGHDFTNYKRPTLLRRIERRINIRNLPDLPSYTAFLREHPDETHTLLKNLLISVTNFFRDSKAFDALEQDVLPAIIAGKSTEDQVRIWVAGCATGEEAYSIAMLCAERLLGLPDAPKIQIFATDIDEAAITTAREGFYTLNDAADVSPDRLRRFFNRDGDGYRVRREIREMILFAHHNFLKDPPFSRLDLVTCRNVLIYLNNTAQERVVETFHFALLRKGFLFLGTSESVDGSSDLYSAFNREHHIFQAREVSVRNYPIPDAVPNFHFATTETPPQEDKGTRSQGISFGDLHQRLLEQYAPPSVVVNEEYDIVHMTERVGKYFEFTGGEPTQNLLKLVRPEIRLELRSALYQAVQNKTVVEARVASLTLDGQQRAVNIHIRPVLNNAEGAKGFLLVIFQPAEDKAQERSAIMMASDEPLALQLEAELIQLKSKLRSSNEQHDYQAEELKASNEELQAMNEELRSAAEELETSKEELQSINEELRTVNQELKVKIDETTVSSNNLQNLINSANVGTIFLDRSFAVRLFTPASQELFNLKAGDYGRPITDITNKLLYKDLLQDAEAVLEKLSVIEREVITTDNRFFMMRVLPYRTSDDRINGVVLTFFDITNRKQSENALRQSEEHRRLLIESAKDYAIFTIDRDRKVVSWSSGAEIIFGYTEAEIIGKPGDIVFIPEDRNNAVPEKEVDTANVEGRAENERWHIRKDGSRFWGSGLTQPLSNGEGQATGFVKIMRDLTLDKRLEEAKFFLAAIVETSKDSVITIDFARNITSWNKAAEELYGYTAKEAVGKNLTMLTLPEDFAEVLNRIDAIEHSRELAVFDTVRRTKEGRAIHLEIVMSPVLNAWGEVIGVSTIARDVSNRKQREADLALLAKINLDLAPLLTMQEVMAPVAAQLASYLEVSRCHFTLVDLDEDRLEVICENLADARLPSKKGVHRISDYFTDEGRRHYSSGNPTVLNLATNSAYVKDPAHLLEQLGVGSLLDVPHLEGGRWRFLLTLGREEAGEWTSAEIELLQELAAKIYIRIERARTEDALRKSEEKYRTLFETIDEGFTIQELITDEDGNVTDLIYRDANRAYEQQSGMADVIGKKGSELFPHLEQHWLDNMTHVYKTGEPVRTEGYQSDVDRWFTLQYARVGAPGSRLISVVFNDITERKKQEQQQAFLLQLSDMLRSESGVGAIATRGLQMLFDHMQLDRCYVGIYKLDEDRGEFPYQVGNDRVPPMPDSVRLSDFPDALQVAFHETLVIDDITKAQNLTDVDKHNLGALGLNALVASTLRRGEGNPFWSIVAISASPRKWKSSDIKLIDEVTERTWAAVERAMSEEALHKSEVQLAAELADTRQLQHVSSQIVQEENIDQLYEEVLNAAIAIMHSSAASLQMYDREKGALSLLAYKGFAQESAEHWRWVSLQSNSACAAALTKMQRFVAPDVENSHSMADTDDLQFYRLSNIRSVQSTPLISRNGNIVGMISTHWPQVHQPSEREFGLMDVLARQVADLFERKRADEALRQSETRFRTLANALPQIIWTNNGDGIADYFNQRWYEYTGLSYEESEGLGWQAIVHPGDAEVSVDKWNKALAAGGVFDTEYRLRGQDGKYYWFIGRNVPLKDDVGKVTGWFGSATDVDNLKKVEEALGQSEARLRITMESATDYAIITMDTKRKVERWSQGAIQVFGYSETEMRGQSVDVIFTDEDVKAGAPQLEMETAMRAGRAADERWHQRKDGTRFFASGVMRPIQNSELTGYVKILRDTTQQQLFTEELHRLVAERTQELQRSNEDLRQFAHVASHDLKEPIRKIQTFNNRILDEYSDALPAKAKIYAEKIGTSAERMVSMIDGVLRYSKLGSTEAALETVDLGVIVQQVMTDLEIMIQQKEAEIKYTALPILRGSTTLLYQLFYNLILNALKFAKTEEPPQIQISSTQTVDDERGVYRIVVSDNGIGFEPEFELEIFKTFTRLHPAEDYEGTGLGLALCKKIAERHGGTITANSDPGMGAKFIILLPITE